jgi:DNA-binding NarL/FixJ family response regulator
MKSRNLEEVNTALKVLLKQREQDKSELEEKVLSNVKGLVLPYLEKLKKSRISKRDMSFVNILESNLTNIISSFTHRLSSRHLNLTPKELQVANLVKEGRTTKEIAEMMGICAGAVSLHRNHVRNKLGINSKKINLQSYLSSLP